MMSSFDTLGKAGVADPESLASNIGITLMSTAAGIVLGIIGVCILAAGVIILFATRQKATPPPLTE
jgi:biopolymer transport protein ExbB/TolQ